MSENNTAENETPTEEKKETPRPAEALVVVSRVKSYIQKTASLNTSQCCIDALTKTVFDLCDRAIEKATASNRKTVMGRDIG